MRYFQTALLLLVFFSLFAISHLAFIVPQTPRVTDEHRVVGGGYITQKRPGLVRIVGYNKRGKLISMNCPVTLGQYESAEVGRYYSLETDK